MGIEPEMAISDCNQWMGHGTWGQAFVGLAAPLRLRSLSAADTGRMPQAAPGCQVSPRTGPPNAVPLLLRNYLDRRSWSGGGWLAFDDLISEALGQLFRLVSARRWCRASLSGATLSSSVFRGRITRAHRLSPLVVRSPRCTYSIGRKSGQ